ncbi:hypothetical protein JVU11DRAFT_11130 [Chiua virens]|nr:hypothetical protein JVU11DRAFT_11130 [Chiua virens]
MGQANNALHAICLALVDKAILFRNDVRHASGNVSCSRTWGKVKSVNTILCKYTTIYKKSRSMMLSLGVDQNILNRYRELEDKDLQVTTNVLQPNGSGHREENLAWFWSMDIPRDTDGDHWMSEFYHVNWLRAKAVRDRWAEELELTSCEFQWTVMFFQMKSDSWVELQRASLHSAQLGHASYAARQATLYCRLWDQCEQMRMKAISMEPSQQMGL